MFNVFKHFFLIVAISFAGYYYYNRFLNAEKFRIKNVLAGLQAEEKSVTLSTEKPVAIGFGASTKRSTHEPNPVAIGFGSCVDLFVDALPFVNSLGLKPPKKAKYHQTIETFEQFSEMFAFYLSNGAAAE